MGVFPALKSGSQISRLTKLIEFKHAGVDLDRDSRQRIYTWIDANVPYYATWDLDRPHTMGGRDPWFTRSDATRRRLEPEPWIREFSRAYVTNCASCHENSFADFTRKMAAWDPKDQIPNWEARPWQSKTGKNRKEQYGQYEQWMNLTNPEHSRLLNVHLAKSAGGLELNNKDGKAPVFKTTADPIYQALLALINAGKQAREGKPAMDMPGAVAVPQIRDFGKSF